MSWPFGGSNEHTGEFDDPCPRPLLQMQDVADCCLSLNIHSESTSSFSACFLPGAWLLTALLQLTRQTHKTKLYQKHTFCLFIPSHHLGSVSVGRFVPCFSSLKLSVILIPRSEVLFMSNQTVSLEAAVFLTAGTVAVTDHRSTVSLSRFPDVVPAAVSLFFTRTSPQTGAGAANEAQRMQRFRKLNPEL